MPSSAQGVDAIDSIDRIGPTLRPDRPVVMRQNWRRLLFAHWELPADALARTLPAGLTLDTFQGRAFVGLVPFTMERVRPAPGPAVPWLSYFPEANVRTYVHVEGANPGVYFYSLEAARALAVLGARTVFGLPYFWARMRAPVDAEGWTHYRSRRLAGRRPATLQARYRGVGTEREAVPGTLEHFLIERYILYARHLGHLVRGRIHHRPYPVRNGEAPELEESLLAASGLERPPAAPLLHYSDGVDVDVFGLERVKPSGS